MTVAPTATATRRLSADEQAAFDFISEDFQKARRFVEQVSAATTADIRSAVVTQIAKADAVLQATYSKRIATDHVGGRVHTLEHTYESLLRSMIVVSKNMKAALAAPTKALAVAAMQAALREVPRLTRRVRWTAHELDALAAYRSGTRARPQVRPG